MKKLYLLGFFSIILSLLWFTVSKTSEDTNTQQLRALHKKHLENSPYKKTKTLSKSERKNLGLPPNAYYERLWELTLDPNTGRPMPERIYQIQNQLRDQRNFDRRGGGIKDNAWIERGPNNVGGRTRAILFDPNDIGNGNPADDYTRVFAGGVSGGLWVNEDITDANSSWTLVPGIGANISVNIIISDPNNSDVFYIGSGEQYVSNGSGGLGVGRGIWKSTDAGVTWGNIFGGYTGISNGNQDINGIFYINDLVARDIGTTTELYASIAGGSYTYSSPSQFHGVEEQGLYKSTDGGFNWSRFNITESDGSFVNPNDIELDINNNIWFTTTRSANGFNGGKIFRSTNGTSFSLIHTIANARRTELEPSKTNVNKFWIAADKTNGEAGLFITTNAFSTVNPMNEPDDVDTDISSTDYARNQAFYNLVIEADASDNLIVGGIDLFRTTNDGLNWSQISKWANNNDLNALNVSLVHADHHAVIQRPGVGNNNKMVFGNDGGVYYTNNIGNSTGIESRNTNYNTSQFYYGTINDEVGTDDLAGGLQDNGTQLSINSSANTNSFTELPLGGDGAFTEIDKEGDYIIQSFTTNTHVYLGYPSLSPRYNISTGTGGSFINEAALDENLDILYSNSSSGGSFSIERTSNFTAGSGGIVNDQLTNSRLNASPTILKVSPHTTASTTLAIGLENGRVLLLKTANDLPNWLNLPNLNPIGEFVGSVSDIEFGEDETEIFVTIHNYGVPSIWFTDDSGTNWRNIEGNLPDLPVKCILQNPLLPKELIIGTDLGVWATPDYTVANPTWVSSFNGMSDVTVLDLDLRSSDNVILAATYGRGLFTSQFTSVPLSTKGNNSINSSVKLYPTVSDGDISISSSLNLGKVNILVYDISGKQVYATSKNLNGGKTILNLSHLSSGLHLIKFVKNNISVTKKIIIK